VPSIAVDAGPLVALFKGADTYHGQALAFMADVSQPMVTNMVVVGEVVALLARGFQVPFLKWVSEALEVDDQTAGDLPRIVAIMEKYADLPADFADASLVAMCERRGIASIATLDRDFDVYRMADRRRLRNVFFSG
jgi:predicted nucleic acid-binding protein